VAILQRWLDARRVVVTPGKWPLVDCSTTLRYSKAPVFSADFLRDEI
jgi:hypothetical protein